MHKCLKSRQTEIDSHINFLDIQVTDSEVGLNAPMSLLAEISNNIHSELMIWNVNCFAIITSYDCR